jgi:hypothetical protein
VSRPFLPHADFGAPDCSGCLLANVRGDEAEITCNECGAILRTVALADLQRTLDEMELSLVMCTALCPHCGKVNIFPGFSEIDAYICQECGRAVETGES